MRYYLFSLIVFILVAFYKLASHVPPPDVVEVNGIEIPIGKCIEGIGQMIPDMKERKEFCTCMADILGNTDGVVEKFRSEHESGKLQNIIQGAQSELPSLNINVKPCWNMGWTDFLAKKIKADLKNQLVGSEFSQSHDVDAYCDCIVEEFRKIPFDEYMSEGFYESKQRENIDSLCIEKSNK